MPSRLLSPFREFGFLAGALYIIDRILSRLSRGTRLFVYELMVQPIPETPLRGASLARNLQVRELRDGDPEIAAMPTPPPMIARRYAQGAICLGAFQKDAFVGYMWFCPRRYDEDEVRCTYVIQPPEQSVFDFDFYIFPKYRMGTAFVGLWNGANRELRARDIRYTFSRLTRFNLASRRAHHHLGWKLVGRATFLQLWPLQLMIATVFPFVHASFGASSGPRLKLSAAALQPHPAGRESAGRPTVPAKDPS
jgi:hypothetical protein